MAIRQARCQNCRLPTGESYDDQTPSSIQAFCSGCRAAARMGGTRDTPADPGIVTINPQGARPIHEEEEHDPEDRHNDRIPHCPECGGTEFECVQIIYERNRMTANTSENEADDHYIYFSDMGDYEYNDTETQEVSCTNCGRSVMGTYDFEVN